MDEKFKASLQFRIFLAWEYKNLIFHEKLGKFGEYKAYKLTGKVQENLLLIACWLLNGGETAFKCCKGKIASVPHPFLLIFLLI